MSDTLILGTRKGLLVFKHNGSGWKLAHEALPGIPVPHAMQDHRTGVMWVTADHGHWGNKLYKSLDGGATLTEVPAPRFPEGATYFDGFPGMGEPVEKPAKVSYLWTVVPGGDDQPNRLYIGTEPGGLFQSDDGGETFHLVEGLWNHSSRPKWWFGGGRDNAGVCSIVVDPRDSNHLIAGISVGGVYESTDGGKTWEGKNKGLRADFLPDPHSEYGHDPHCTVACRTNPDVLWQQNHCGIFRSTDGGRHWADVSQPEKGIKFGFPIVVDANDPNTAWVVPGISDELRMAVKSAMFVGRTEDGGRTWTELRKGLPQGNCYDIVFRHALDIEGEGLAFGSTTGNLFFSANRGDTWETVGNYLPPIYSVRFV